MTGLVLIAILVLLFGHWVFDFVLQPDWMGKGKSKSWRILTQHTVRITLGSFATFLTIALVCGKIGWTDGDLIWSYKALLFAALNGSSHFVIDAVTSRMTSRRWAAGKVHDFFVVIGFDQFLHLTIFVTTLWWLFV